VTPSVQQLAQSNVVTDLESSSVLSQLRFIDSFSSFLKNIKSEMVSKKKWAMGKKNKENIADI
jgi:hypothetical protein